MWRKLVWKTAWFLREGEGRWKNNPISRWATNYVWEHSRWDVDLDLTPIETLIYYDGPLTFTIKDGYLVHRCDRGDNTDTYLVAKITSEELEALQANKLPLYDVLYRKPLRLATETRYTGEIRVKDVLPEELPTDYFPMKDLCLYPKEDR